jgi:hypothetical protein
MSLGYQQQVREWLAAYINFSLSTRVGTELQSLLSQGINTLTSFEIGWNIKLIDGDKYTFSTVVELQNNEGSLHGKNGSIDHLAPVRLNLTHIV